MARRGGLRTREAEGVLLPADIAGKHLFDWECGRGVFSTLLVEHGAPEVTGIDRWLDAAAVAATFGRLPQASFEARSARGVRGPGPVRPDLRQRVDRDPRHLPEALTGMTHIDRRKEPAYAESTGEIE